MLQLKTKVHEIQIEKLRITEERDETITQLSVQNQRLDGRLVLSQKTIKTWKERADSLKVELSEMKLNENKNTREIQIQTDYENGSKMVVDAETETQEENTHVATIQSISENANLKRLVAQIESLESDTVLTTYNFFKSNTRCASKTILLLYHQLL